MPEGPNMGMQGLSSEERRELAQAEGKFLLIVFVILLIFGSIGVVYSYVNPTSTIEGNQKSAIETHVDE